MLKPLKDLERSV